MVRISIKPNKPGFYLIFDVTKVYQPDRLLVQELLILKAQIDPQDTDLIFPSVNGNTIKAEVSNKHFKASCDRAGIKRNGRTQYSLRHTFDTELLKRLSRETVQDLMGHTSYRKEYDHRTGEDLLVQLQDIVPVIESRF